MQPTAGPSAERDARFSGHWGVEETVAHALDARGAVQLNADGKVTWLEAFGGFEWTQLMGFSLTNRQSGAVERCVFADSSEGIVWRSAGPSILYLPATCATRGGVEVRMEVNADTSRDFAALPIERVSVGDDQVKLGEIYGFRMFRCVPGAARTECRPF
jgi:hypothetical protein